MTARENYFLHRGFMRHRFIDGVQSESLKNHSLRARNDNDLSQGFRSRRQEVLWLMTSSSPALHKTFDLLSGNTRMYFAERPGEIFLYLHHNLDRLQTVNILRHIAKL